MKRLIAVALFCVVAGMSLAGCHARTTDIKPVGSTVLSHAVAGRAA